MYTIKNEQFEGPLDLLLQLIEKEKLDICELSLAKITNGYLERIYVIEAVGEEIANFLVIASKLLYIKSKRLIPDISTEEEEEEIRDLEEKLKEYQKYKNAAKHLEKILKTESRSWNRKAKNEKTPHFMPPKDFDKVSLYKIFQEILQKINEETKEEEIVEIKRFTLEEKRDHIKNIIKNSKKISFRNILDETTSKMEIIVTFLAILEMIKQKEISVTQKNNFADFSIEGLK